MTECIQHIIRNRNMRCYVCLQVIEVPGIIFEYKLEILVHQEMLLKVTEINISAKGRR